MIHWTKTLAAAVAILMTLAADAPRAVEVSLEENRAERGNIGYVDMQSLFRLYPETQKAKENFEEVVRQAEDQVNLRKSEIIALRSELSQLRMQRSLLAKTPINADESPEDAAPPPPPIPVIAPSTATAKPAAQAPVHVSTIMPVAPAITSVFPSTASVVAASTGAPVISLSSAAVASLASTVFSTTTAPSVSESTRAAIAISTVAASPVPAPTPATEPPPVRHEAKSSARSAAPAIPNLPGIAPEPPEETTPATAPEAANPLADLDRQIKEKTKVLKNKEAEFKTYQSQVEKNLLDLENRRTEILLGKLYDIVQKGAREEGVSVVVDKSQILFGVKAVDLTPKVMQKIKSL